MAQELLKGLRANGPFKQELAKRFRKFLPNLVEQEPEREIEAKQVLLQDLEDLRNKFAEIERLQAQTISRDLLRPFTFLTLLAEESLYTRAFRDLT